jgi:hypothetical protein
MGEPMTVRRLSSLALTLLCGALIAGCGSSSSNTGSATTSSTPAQTSSATTSSQKASTTPTSPASTSSTASTPSTTPAVTGGTGGAAQYADICKSIIQHEPTLSGSLKGKLEGICAKAADGNLAAAQAAARQVCVEVINATPIPTADKAKALADCKAS